MREKRALTCRQSRPVVRSNLVRRAGWRVVPGTDEWRCRGGLNAFDGPGIPVEELLRSWGERHQELYDMRDVDPYLCAAAMSQKGEELVADVKSWSS
jgi:hypothetical protein